MLPRTVCKREITRDEALVYLRDGTTELLPDFTSRFGRPFSAQLVLKENGRHGFEFPPRAEGAGRGRRRGAARRARRGGRSHAAAQGGAPAQGRRPAPGSRPHRRAQGYARAPRGRAPSKAGRSAPRRPRSRGANDALPSGMTRCVRVRAAFFR